MKGTDFQEKAYRPSLVWIISNDYSCQNIYRDVIPSCSQKNFAILHNMLSCMYWSIIIFNPFTSCKSWKRISPHNVETFSSSKAMRGKEKYNLGCTGLFNSKFVEYKIKEMHSKKYRELMFWYWEWKGWYLR